MSRWNLVWLLAVPAAVALGLVVMASAPPPDKDYQLVRNIVDVLAEVDQNYVRELNDKEKQKLVEDMINGGLGRLDPYSQYFNAEQLAAFETQSEGQYAGVGILLALDADAAFLKVESPLPGTPAYNAGIQARMPYMVWHTYKSWYLSPDGSNHALYPGFAAEYALRTRWFDARDYVIAR